MVMSFGIKNLTGAELTIADLGLLVDASAVVDLAGRITPDHLRGSSSALQAVNADQMVVIDGGEELSKSDSLLFLSGARLSPEASVISTVTISGTDLTITGTLVAEQGEFELGLTVAGAPVVPAKALVGDSFVSVVTGTNTVSLYTDAIIAGAGIQVTSGTNTITITNTGSAGSAPNAIVGTAGQITVTSGSSTTQLSFPATVTGTTAQFLTITGTTGQFGGALSAQTGSFSFGLTISGTPVAVVDNIGDNLLINGGFFINQRFGPLGSCVFPFNNDDVYTADRWNLLSDGNDVANVTLIQTNVPEEGSPQMVLAFGVQTANKKFGIFQPIEKRDCYEASGKPVSLQLKLSNRSASGSITHVRAAILGWNGTADVLTSDVVSSWNAEGTNPSWVSGWHQLNTPADLDIATSSGTLALNKIENIPVPVKTFNNLGVFIWSDDTTTTFTHFLVVGDVKLEIGPKCTPYREPPVALELARCQRFFCKTLPQANAVGNGVTSNGCLSVHSSSNSAGDVRAMWRFPVEMRTTPTITTYNTLTSPAGSWNRGGTGIAATTANIGSSGATITNSAGTVADATHVIHAAADAEL